jgi:hypothetical protein
MGEQDRQPMVFLSYVILAGTTPLSSTRSSARVSVDEEPEA